MGTQVKGKCKYCGKEYTKGYMIRHLATCKARIKSLEAETGDKQCGYFELVIYSKYDNDYWMIIEVKETATLKDVDVFLREIWLECCGHLSAFEISGVSYEAVPVKDYFGGRAAKSMNSKLKTVIKKDMLINYEYDFGSSTDLIIHVKNYRIGCERKEQIIILSRNNSEEFICGACGKNVAVYIDPLRIFDGNPFLCEDCSELPEYDSEYLLRVCNSPRMGVCGYDGSEIYPDQFIPDAETEKA